MTKVWVVSGDGGDGCVHTPHVFSEKYTREQIEEILRKEHRASFDEWADEDDEYEELEFGDHLGPDCYSIELHEVEEPNE